MSGCSVAVAVLSLHVSHFLNLNLVPSWRLSPKLRRWAFRFFSRVSKILGKLLLGNDKSKYFFSVFILNPVLSCNLHECPSPSFPLGKSLPSRRANLPFHGGLSSVFRQRHLWFVRFQTLPLISVSRDWFVVILDLWVHRMMSCEWLTYSFRENSSSDMKLWSLPSLCLAAWSSPPWWCSPCTEMRRHPRCPVREEGPASRHVYTQKLSTDGITVLF